VLPSRAVADSIQIELRGHLSSENLSTALVPVAARIAESPAKIALVVDCREMTGYDAAARVAFVDWNRIHKTRLGRVAIVTGNKLWHMVIAAMSLASSQTMQAFEDPTRASDWAREG
jgi:hypothetical protein